MASDTVMRVRIDAQVKEKAAKLLAEMGLLVAYAIRLLLARVADEKSLPFDVKKPNAETRAAMAELAAGEGKSLDSVKAPIADLNGEGLSAPLHSNATIAEPGRYLATVASVSG